jgi:hypothetical protein
VGNPLVESERGAASKRDGFVGQEKKTSTLRHFFERVEPMGMVLIEPILKEAFALTNEYWVSFSFEGEMYDKRYIFVVGSMEPSNYTLIPFLNRRGVMIR